MAVSDPSVGVREGLRWIRPTCLDVSGLERAIELERGFEQDCLECGRKVRRARGGSTPEAVDVGQIEPDDGSAEPRINSSTGKGAKASWHLPCQPRAVKRGCST